MNASKTSDQISDISCKSVEELNDYFINAAGCINNNNSVKGVVSNLKCKKFVFDIIYVDKVFNLLAKLLDKVNSDILSLDSKLLRSIADIIAPSLTFIFNLSLQSGVFPAELKKARVVPIYKGKSSTKDYGNYRPITIVSHISKILEKLINDQLMAYLSDNHILTSLAL